MEIIIVVVVLVGLLIASYTDLKTREVPDWLNYALVAIGIGANSIFSLVYWDYSYILNSVLGFTMFFVFGLLMYYTGQWGGGDSKALMGIGALVGLNLSGFPFALSLLINILVVGAAYGILWGVYLIIKKWNKFSKEAKKLFDINRRVRNIIFLIAFLLVVAYLLVDNSIFRLAFIVLGVTTVLIYFMFILVKAVENVCMLKYVKPSELTEGDWIARDVKVNGKRITGPKDLGIEKKQIAILKKYYKQGKVRKILIKEGIPFVPSFLIGYIVTLVFGNLFFYLV